MMPNPPRRSPWVLHGVAALLTGRALIATMAAVMIVGTLPASAAPRDRSFNDGWRFHLGDVTDAPHIDLDDTAWRQLDLPHDWSIEDRPADPSSPELSDPRVGPFEPAASQGGHFTGHTVGGTGWYRRSFETEAPGKRVAVRFDGVYMNAEVWINGHRLGEHPHGYTAFGFDLTDHLHPPGETNVLAVKVRNHGRNSRWYSGSGIYRSVWLTTTDPIHIPTWGVFVTTPEVSEASAATHLAVEVRNTTATPRDATVRVSVKDASGHEVAETSAQAKLPAASDTTVELSAVIDRPARWSPDSPTLYTAEVAVVVAGETIDSVTVPFGVRTIAFDAEHGFRLNGETLLLKGGNVHHDNGPLGAAAIDRAEERRVELLKANGFNAVRCAHNPPSTEFLNACDRLGVLVINEAFDGWREPKENRHEGYQRFFEDWCEHDIAAMVRRDRNHPSVIMWSVGNEIPEQFRDPATGRRLREAVHEHDTTRPVTQAICTDWGEVIKHWDERSDPAFKHLDVAGYNYLSDKYEPDHARHPDRVMYGAETFPLDAFKEWSLVEKNPYVIGDFVWTAMDYLGEAGLAHSVLSTEPNPFFMPWPWTHAGSGDLDLCGFKKPPSYYRDVVWRNSAIEMAVHEPLPEGAPEGTHEVLSWWAWPRQQRSWNWPGREGDNLKVAVYTRAKRVRLELNGKVIDEKPVSEDTKLTARFDVPYAPGKLRAIALSDGTVVGDTALNTTGRPARLRLTADRDTIHADRDDLSYVTVEVVDDLGRRVRDAEVNVRFITTGAGKLAAQANGVPDRPASFRVPECETYRGRCLAILRPTGADGEIVLVAQAEGLEPATLTVRCVTP